MRLDLFLKKSGIIKRRAIAKMMIEKGLIVVDGQIVKPSFIIRPCVISVTFGERQVDFPITDKDII